MNYHWYLNNKEFPAEWLDVFKTNDEKTIMFQEPDFTSEDKTTEMIGWAIAIICIIMIFALIFMGIKLSMVLG